ncbi:OOP family OmpA-OmpF porin [Paraburkholderia sp. GAS199]|uniref:OmpA family protein n=1 Tax=Paraburkholderia sp. GAS199 TaxID=3035126 RepID=UPI003D1FC74F
MKFRLSILAISLVLSGCADHAARERLGIEDATVLKSGIGATQNDAAGAASKQWVDTYVPIGSSRSALDALQKRLDVVPGNKSSYFHAKAQCWIDAGKQASLAHDHWGFVEEAIGQAAVLTMGLEKDTPLSAVNPPLRTVSTVRPDLWTIVNAIKSDPALAVCPEAQKPLACAEVELMQAGHDAWVRNFPGAEKQLPDVQAKLKVSAETALQCTHPAAPKVVPAVAAPAPQKITLRADSMFNFDGGNEAAMLPAGKRRLDAVAAGLRTAPSIERLKVTGFTDPLGSVAYNQKLSLQRAQTVAQYLRSHGVTLPISAQGQGEANQLVNCNRTKRDELVKCLAPNRRVEIEFVGTKR